MAFRNYLVLFVCLVAGTYGSGHASAQPASSDATSATGMLHFTFRDSSTGIVVRPDAILIDEQMVYRPVDEAGRVSVPVPPGDHRVVVKARGYTDLDSRQTAALDHAPMNLLMLDPVNQPEQLKPENLSQGMPHNGTLIAGFVTDDILGKPITGADVELLKQDLKVKTDQDGFFKLPVPIPDGKTMPEDTRGIIYGERSFKVSKPGYGFEERLNVLLESGSPKVYQIQLVRGGGGSSLDESDGRNNLQSSLFGLRNVEPEDEATTPTAPEDRVTSKPKNGDAHTH